MKPKGIRFRITTMKGNSRQYTVPNKDTFETFVREYPKHIASTDRVHIECDLLGVSGWVSGKSVAN